MLHVLLVFLLLVPIMAHADVACDGIDDDLTTGLTLTNFLSATTGSMVLLYVPTGTPSSSGAACWQGENLLSDGSGGFAGLFRTNNLAGADRLCGYNWDGSEDSIGVAYTVNVPVHLAWVHSGGQLLFYKDGALVSSIASGNTENITGGSVRFCLFIGGAATPGEGRFIEGKLYNVALTAAQIATEGTSAVHNVIPVAATARWNFDDCSVGTSTASPVFRDRSGNLRDVTGNWGANATGLNCLGSSIPYPWGVW